MNPSTFAEPAAVSAEPVLTKRIVIAQVALCQGCCCGNVARKKPAVPVDALKAEWRRLGLSKTVQLTVSGCLGPCDVLNVVRVSGRGRDEWIGNLIATEDFLELARWAEQCKIASGYVALPQRLRDKCFDPFALAVPAAQDIDRPVPSGDGAGAAS